MTWLRSTRRIRNLSILQAAHCFLVRMTDVQIERELIEVSYAASLMAVTSGLIVSGVLAPHFLLGSVWTVTWDNLTNLYLAELIILLAVLLSSAFAIGVAGKIVRLHNWILMVKRGWPWAIYLSLPLLGRSPEARYGLYTLTKTQSARIAQVVNH